MLNSFGIIFVSIFLEALPFVILGTFLSSLIEVYLPPDWIERRFRDRKRHTYLIAGLIGIVFPVCECAIVPIMRRLVKKGMPLSLGVTFMLAAPIVNPVVLLSTYYAFNGQWRFVAGRGIFGYILAVVIGMIVARYDSKKVLLEQDDHEAHDTGCSCGHDHGHDSEPCSCGHDHIHEEASCDSGHEHSHSHEDQKSLWSTVSTILAHTGAEIMDVGRFLILGALITATMQTFVPRSVFTTISGNPILAIIIMMVLAFVLSLCSEADAFIAATFANQFPPTALMAFMVFGPMIDIKNTLMLAGSFKRAFVIRLVTIITVTVFLAMSLVAFTGIMGG